MGTLGEVPGCGGKGTAVEVPRAFMQVWWDVILSQISCSPRGSAAKQAQSWAQRNMGGSLPPQLWHGCNTSWNHSEPQALHL